jgi:hypothetical protein
VLRACNDAAITPYLEVEGEGNLKGNKKNYSNLPMKNEICKLYKAKMIFLKLLDLDVDISQYNSFFNS